MDRGNILPRPLRPIPIWIGGFGEPAFRRGARLGDGFMFAGEHSRCLFGWEQVQGMLADEGRDVDGYGADLVTTGAKSVDEVLAAIDSWRAAGGTHVSVSCTGMGLDSTDAHLDFINRVADRLG